MGIIYEHGEKKLEATAIIALVSFIFSLIDHVVRTVICAIMRSLCLISRFLLLLVISREGNRLPLCPKDSYANSENNPDMLFLFHFSYTS